MCRRCLEVCHPPRSPRASPELLNKRCQMPAMLACSNTRNQDKNRVSSYSQTGLCSIVAICIKLARRGNNT